MNQSATGLTMLAGGGPTSSVNGVDNLRPMSIAATSLHRGGENNNNSALERRMTETLNFGRGAAA